MSEGKITVKEFRMWLQGVEEMQDSAWVPNPTQWARIREKINTIEEAEPTPAHAATSAPSQYHQPPMISYPIPTGNELPGVPAGPSSMAATRHMSPPPPPASGLFATPESPNMPVRTPNIDTTNGSYQSSFA